MTCGPRTGAVLGAALATAIWLTGWGPSHAGDQQTTLSGPLRYQVVAGAPRLNRELLGPVTRWVGSVPAEPVDSFNYDGVGSAPIDGRLLLEIDPASQTGFILASWTDSHGDWTYKQTRFVHPEHSSGVRIGSSVDEVDSILNRGVTHDVYVHGDTLAGTPVLPTLFCYLVTWGPAEVTLNGAPFDNPFEIPAPLWLGHMMVSEGVRFPDGTVRNRAGQVYDPQRDATDGAREQHDLEAHLVFHDERFPRTTNQPDLFSFFYHLVFEDVVIQLVQADHPIVVPQELLEDVGGGRRERRHRTGQVD